MSSTVKSRRPLPERLAQAWQLRLLLEPHCERVEIAGSIRRGRPDPADVELVAVPRLTPVAYDLFGDVTATTDELHACCERLRDEGRFADRLGVDGKAAFGRKYKRLLWAAPDGESVPLDLFCPTPEAFGLILLLRTGPGGFSRRVVTPRGARPAAGGTGWLPEGLQVFDGWLWRFGVLVPTPEEADVFEALGLPWLEPQARTDTVRSVGPAGGPYRWSESGGGGA